MDSNGYMHLNIGETLERLGIDLDSRQDPDEEVLDHADTPSELSGLRPHWSKV